ncbi:MAG: hypothetical protein L0Z62_23815 [Gemmataceae bacterium]|nr:hypothetical protein [Gemmataceae bacterium]
MGDTIPRPRAFPGASPAVDAPPPAAPAEADDVSQPSAAPPEQTDQVACPACGGKLIDPDGLGWCQACGYCRSMQTERTREQRRKPRKKPPRGDSPLGVVEFFCLLAATPRWVYALFGGVGAIVLLSLLPNQLFADSPLGRCLWCTCQLAVGVIFVLAAQSWAVMVLADSDERLSGKDAIFSGRLWVLAVRKLPATQRQFCLGLWGLTTILCAFFLVGGLTHWLTYLPRSANAPPPAAAKK